MTDTGQKRGGRERRAGSRRVRARSRRERRAGWLPLCSTGAGRATKDTLNHERCDKMVVVEDGARLWFAMTCAVSATEPCANYDLSKVIELVVKA